MPGATEIYICRPGQALRDGKLEYSHDVTTRAQAEADAIRRCRADQGIARIAYYAVSDDGRFRSFYTYENPDQGKRRPRPASSGRAPALTRRAGPARSRKPSMMERLRAFLATE